MRLFVAVELPDHIKDELSKIASELQSDGVILSKVESYHITLQFLGEVVGERIESIKEALSSVRQPPFRSMLSGLSYFDPQRIRVVFANVRQGSEELKSIYSQVDTAIAERGITYKREYDYLPHVTLARIKYLKSREALFSIIERNSDYAFGSFQVDSIVLKQSIQTDSVHVHKTLHEAKL